MLSSLVSPLYRVSLIAEEVVVFYTSSYSPPALTLLFFLFLSYLLSY
ncbi:unnamed protein product [Cercospora beticola]|nr:unnamed protein product [Cercospora beticola]